MEMKRPAEMLFEEFKKLRKKAADDLKEYLKGKVIKTGSGIKIKGRRKARDSFAEQKSMSFLRKKRKLRKKRNMATYKSKRINRLKSK